MPAAASTGDIDEAKKTITASIGYGDGEAQYLTTWLTRALDYGLTSRLRPEGLPAADIIEYLPVERIVPQAASWEALHELHEEARLGKTGTPHRFKDWLELRYKTKFDEQSLRACAAGVDIPRDFERLMKSIEALSAERTSPLHWRSANRAVDRTVHRRRDLRARTSLGQHRICATLRDVRRFFANRVPMKNL